MDRFRFRLYQFREQPIRDLEPKLAVIYIGANPLLGCMYLCVLHTVTYRTVISCGHSHCYTLTTRATQLLVRRSSIWRSVCVRSRHGIRHHEHYYVGTREIET